MSSKVYYNSACPVCNAGIKDQRQRDAVTVDFAPLAGSKVGELSARWDLVMGLTPELT